MEFGGRYRVGADRQAVWTALNDAAILKACIPGCQRLQWVGESELALEVAVNLGVVKPVFSGSLMLSNVDPARSYTLSGQGKGGLLGKAQAASDITLSDIENDTLLVFAAHAGASGRMMKLGRSLIGGSAQAIIDKFFARFGAAMGATVTPIAPADPDSVT